jgi:hypothetical protein
MFLWYSSLYYVSWEVKKIHVFEARSVAAKMAILQKEQIALLSSKK